MHNPFLAYPVSGTWTGPHPAIDYATPVGVEFGAPTGGVYRRLRAETAWTPGAAGVYGDLVLDDGRRIRFCHLSRHIAADRARVAEGDILAATGNTGYVLPRPTAQAPHLGAHMHTTGFHADGTRWNWTLDTESGDDMALNAGTDYEAFKAMLYRALKWDVRENGAGADSTLGATIWDRFGAIQRGQQEPAPVTIDYDKLADAIVRRAIGS